MITKNSAKFEAVGVTNIPVAVTRSVTLELYVAKRDDSVVCVDDALLI